jgi:uncharacterized protein (DUF1697 family)
MPVIISMLRGVNLAAHNRIRMDELRELYESLGLRHAQTYIQSGNVIFWTQARDLASLAKRIENGIERRFGFRPAVILRTSAELRDVIARNPFAGRDLEPSRFLVTFLSADPSAEACSTVLKIRADPEELRINGREVYIYYPNGIARPRLSWVLVEKTLKTSGTGRNWNTVRKLLEIADKLEASRL